jgi:copper oxidase (laccase) domain-containing protein
VTEIDADDHCTVPDAALFFTHRREKGLTGRVAAVIGTRR